MVQKGGNNVQCQTDYVRTSHNMRGTSPIVIHDAWNRVEPLCNIKMDQDQILGKKMSISHMHACNSWILLIKYSQWQNSCNDRPDNIRSMSNPHTRYVCNMACICCECAGTVVWWSIVLTHNTVWGRLARNMAGCPIGSRWGTHLRPVRTFE